MNRDALIDLADDLLDRLDRTQRWWDRQSPHPALTQLLLVIVVLAMVIASEAGAVRTPSVVIGAVVCIVIGWVCGLLGCFRSVGALRPQPEAASDDDATVDVDPGALDARRRFRLWSACFWWLQTPWLVVTGIGGMLRAIALIRGSAASDVGLGCTLVPFWGVSIPVGMWLWQRHFRRSSRAMGSRTEGDLDPRVWWFAVASMAASFVWAGLLILR